MAVAVQRIPIARPYLDADAVEALRPCFESGWITMGPAVAQFEQEMESIIGVPAVACSSCTAGMHLALLAWGIGPGDEVVVPAYSFIASAHAVACTGATPIFCDVDPVSGQIDPQAAAGAISERTRAIMAVHLFGIPAPMRELQEIAGRHELKLLEDAACALGATYFGEHCGALSDAGSFSFHPRKVVTMGEGGTLTSADGELREHARAQRNHGTHISGFDRHQAGQGSYPAFDLLGFNYRLTDLQARLGLLQLPLLDEIVGQRRAQAARYIEAFADLEGVQPLLPTAGGEPCWQSFSIHLQEAAPLGAAELREHLGERGIQAVQSGQVLPAAEYYRERTGWRPGAFPVSEQLVDTGVSIPLFAGLKDSEQQRIVEAVRECWS